MRTTSRIASLARVTAALIGAAGIGAAGAQQPLDTKDVSAARVQTASCAEVLWKTELLERYPRIADGCQEIVIADGSKWARFEADLVRSNPDGSATLAFKNRKGRPIQTLTLMPPPEQRAVIDGRPALLADVMRGQALNLYVPEAIFASSFAVEVGAPAARLEQLMRNRIALAQTDVAPRQRVRAVVGQAQLEPRLPGPSAIVVSDRRARIAAQVLGSDRDTPD